MEHFPIQNLRGSLAKLPKFLHSRSVYVRLQHAMDLFEPTYCGAYVINGLKTLYSSTNHNTGEGSQQAVCCEAGGASVRCLPSGINIFFAIRQYLIGCGLLKRPLL